MSLMIVCAVGAVLLFALGAFEDLRDAWKHPAHRDLEDVSHHPKPKLR
jgi:hypothetical protein